METNQAVENLQTIRTLMERAAVYRRALAPIMFVAGAAGVLASAVAISLHSDSDKTLGLFWLATATVVVVATFLITRRQALVDGEPFWSPPTKRVGEALALPFVAGLCIGLYLIFKVPEAKVVLVYAWMICYGGALHSAGFFISRGIRWFGWFYALSSIILMFTSLLQINPNLLMGLFFGVVQIACGLYLRFTEKGKAPE